MLYVEVGNHLYHPKAARFFQILFLFLGTILLISGLLSFFYSIIMGMLASIFSIFCIYYSHVWHKGIKEYKQLVQDVSCVLEE